MAFSFRLDTVLRYRKRLVDDQSRLVANAEKKLRHLETRVTEIEAEMAQAISRGELPDGTPLHLGDLLAKRRWITFLGQRRIMAVRQRDLARKSRDEVRNALEESWRRHEVLLKLRQRKRAAHDTRQIRIETLEMDEAAATRHGSAGVAIPAGYPADRAYRSGA